MLRFAHRFAAAVALAFVPRGEPRTPRRYAPSSTTAAKFAAVVLVPPGGLLFMIKLLAGGTSVSLAGSVQFCSALSESGRHSPSSLFSCLRGLRPLPVPEVNSGTFTPGFGAPTPKRLKV